MKRSGSIIVILLVLCLLQACRHASTETGTSDTSSSGATDTSSTLNLAVDKQDSDFAVDAATGNAAEVELGKLAVKNGTSKKVKNFGLMMIKEHGKANLKLMALSKSKNLNLPTSADAAGQKMIADLSKKTGSEFDKAYISSMIIDHTNDVKKFTAATEDIQDPDLKKYAIKTLPVLQKHLDAINAIHDSMSQ